MDSTKNVQNRKPFEAAKKKEIERRRWVYPEGWKTWPETIAIVDNHGTGIGREYKRAECRHTSNQSALWIRQNNPLYLMLKPNVSRVGGDHAIISPSLNHDDTCSILVEFNSKWQPCDALFDKHPNVENLYFMVMLAVHPNYRRRGIANMLIEESLKVCMVKQLKKEIKK